MGCEKRLFENAKRAFLVPPFFLQRIIIVEMTKDHFPNSLATASAREAGEPSDLAKRSKPPLADADATGRSAALFP